MWKNHPRVLPFSFQWDVGTIWLLPDDRHFYFIPEGCHCRFQYGWKKNPRACRNFYRVGFFTPFSGFTGWPLSRLQAFDHHGGLLMGVGYCLMSIHNLQMLYFSMTLVILGNGFFKPNISTLLGNVYSTPAIHVAKDEGCNIFYMGINIGAFVWFFLGRPYIPPSVGAAL